MKKLYSVVAFLFFIESVMTQAPGDGSEICLPGGFLAFLRFPIPENMKVLMESRDYETLLGNLGEPDTWQQVDVDGLIGGGTIWNQQGDEGCRQVVIVCGFNIGQQNNWLITQHISRQTTTLLPQVTVIVEHEFSDCDAVMNCARTFSIWKYDNSTIDTTLARDTSKYTQVANIAPEDTTGNVRQNETIEIDFSGSETGFYLAIRDEDSCLLIHRVLVFYYVCPGMTENLIIHPEILAPPISPTSQPINVNGGRCVPNAATTGGGNPILTCSQGGIWSVIVNCTCTPGFSMNADGTACIVCSAGNYATSTSCLPCPANSNSTEPTTECPCFDGFYRNPGEGPGGDCALPPSAPSDLTVENRTDTTASLTWQEPTSAGGGSDLQYNLFFQTPGADFRTLFGTVSETQGLITGLCPFLSYILFVSSETSVTGDIPEELFSERSVNTTVAETEPDLVSITNDGVVSVNGLVITWSIPASTLPFLRTYHLTLSDDSGNIVRDEVTNDTRFDATSLGLTSGTYAVKVRAIVNIDGCSGDLPVIVGSGASLILTDTQTSGTGTIIASVVASAVFIVSVVIAVVTILIFCLRRARKTSVDSTKEDISTKREAETDTLAMAYQGNSSLASVELMSLPRTLIIPASQLNLKDILGQGEFGIVHKAFFKRYTDSETEVVAVKTLKGLFSSRDVHGLIQEVLKMKAFHHIHVMSLVGVCLDAGAGPAIVMPYMANGSLLDYLRKERDSLLLDDDASPNKVSETQKFLLNVCLQIAEGMEYLAQEKVVHRDLSARNCMIDAEGIIKVADFGLSEDIYSSNYYRQGKEDEGMKLPIKWMAVESILDGIFTEKSDVWSFGITMWEVYSGGKLPYPGMTSSALIQYVASGGRLSKLENAACSDEVYSCMQQCWLEVADKRPHFHDLVATISKILESIAGYLDLQRSVSLIKRVKRDVSRSPRPKRPNSETPRLGEGADEEQVEGKEGEERAPQQAPIPSGVE